MRYLIDVQICFQFFKWKPLKYSTAAMQNLYIKLIEGDSLKFIFNHFQDILMSLAAEGFTYLTDFLCFLYRNFLIFLRLNFVSKRYADIQGAFQALTSFRLLASNCPKNHSFNIQKWAENKRCIKYNFRFGLSVVVCWLCC